MAVSAKIKNLAPGAYFNAGPVEVVVLEHFTDGRTLLAAKEPIGNRSEERRVGKECRSRWSPYH